MYCPSRELFANQRPKASRELEVENFRYKASLVIYQTENGSYQAAAQIAPPERSLFVTFLHKKLVVVVEVFVAVVV